MLKMVVWCSSNGIGYAKMTLCHAQLVLFIHSFISLKSTMTKRTAVTIEVRLEKCKVNSHTVMKIQ